VGPTPFRSAPLASRPLTLDLTPAPRPAAALNSPRRGPFSPLPGPRRTNGPSAVASSQTTAALPPPVPCPTHAPTSDQHRPNRTSFRRQQGPRPAAPYPTGRQAEARAASRLDAAQGRPVPHPRHSCRERARGACAAPMCRRARGHARARTPRPSQSVTITGGPVVRVRVRPRAPAHDGARTAGRTDQRTITPSDPAEPRHGDLRRWSTDYTRPLLDRQP